MNRLASSSSQVRKHRTAPTPGCAAHASARSDAFVCRALCPLAFAFGVRRWLLSPTISQANLVCRARPARQALSVSHHHVSPTPPSSRRRPASRRSRLKSNVGRSCKLALMREPSRIVVAFSSHASRGGHSVPGCSRVRSQRSICTPRSMPARVRFWGSALASVSHHFSGSLGLSGNSGAASAFCLASPRKPNPAFERTA